MTDATRHFFERLGSRGYEPQLRPVNGTLRFDLKRRDGINHWFVTVDTGDVAISHGDEPADCVVGMDRALFDRTAAGKVNMMTAVLRGLVEPEGDVAMLVLFQRLFPGPPGARERTQTAARIRRQP